MRLKGRLIAVPHWIHTAVTQVGLPLSSLLNLNELSEHFSTDDIVSYHCVNKLFNSLKFGHSTDDGQDKLLCYSEVFNKLDLVTEAVALSSDVQYHGPQQSKLLTVIEDEASVFLKSVDLPPHEQLNVFNNMVATSPFSEHAVTDTHLYVVSLFHIENQDFGLTLKPYDGVQTDVELVALDNNMQLLLTYYKYEEVCQTQIFHRWCYRMKQNQQHN